jgi:WXG100 family type VII secretion target
MTSYQVSLEQMAFVEGEMRATTDRLKVTLTDLDDAAKQHLAEWSSDARDAYNQAKAKWDAAAGQMVVELGQASGAVGQIGEYYTSGEKYGVSLWEQ